METKEEYKERILERRSKPNISRVRELRTNKGISQQEIADFLGIGQVAYSQKENEKTKFSLKEAKLLAIYFNTNVENLFFEPILNAI